MSGPKTKILAGAVLAIFLATNLFLRPVIALAQAPDPVKTCTVDQLVGVVGGKIIGAVGGLIKTGIGAGLKALGIPNPFGGGPQQVKEVGDQKSEIQKLSLRTCLNAVKDALFKAALAKFKKRLLDRITDDTIAWINGETDGSPKFVTDFGGLLEDSAQAAIGDTIREIGLGAVCQPFKARLQLVLQQPPKFSRQVSCTLDQVVDNIEGFYDNFRDGGWLAYNEITKPRNNYYGALSLALDETARKTSQRQAATEQEVISGQGFLSIKQCLEWTLYARVSEGANVEAFEMQAVSDAFDFGDPSSPPRTTSNGDPLLPGWEWKCTKNTVTTPGKTIAGTLDRAVAGDIDYIVNSDDLSPYIAAIFDAAINRLIKSGVKGLAGIAKSESVSGRAPQTYPAGDRYLDYGGNYGSDIGKASTDSVKRGVDDAIKIIGDLKILIADVLNANGELMDSLGEVANCEISRSGQVCSDTSSSTADAQGLDGELNSSLSSLPQIETDLRAIKTEVDIKELSDASLESYLTIVTNTLNQLEETKNNLTITRDGILNAIETLKNKLIQCQDVSFYYSCSPPPPLLE